MDSRIKDMYTAPLAQSGERNRVLRNTYLLLALSMLPTVLAMAPSGEADDVAASLVLHRRRPGQRVFVVSTDKDLWQLYGAPMTKIIGLKNKALTGDDIRAKFGLSTASMIPAWKALLGDTSDCVPRVPRLLAADAVVWLNLIFRGPAGRHQQRRDLWHRTDVTA